MTASKGYVLQNEDGTANVAPATASNHAMSKGQFDSAGLMACRVYTATVASGSAVFYPTNTGAIDGAAVFSVIHMITPIYDVADPLKAFSKPVVSNENKTITVPCRMSQQNAVVVLGITVIGSTTLVNAPNGTTLTILVHGLLA